MLTDKWCWFLWSIHTEAPDHDNCYFVCFHYDNMLVLCALLHTSSFMVLFYYRTSINTSMHPSGNIFNHHSDGSSSSSSALRLLKALIWLSISPPRANEKRRLEECAEWLITTTWWLGAMNMKANWIMIRNISQPTDDKHDAHAGKSLKLNLRKAELIELQFCTNRHRCALFITRVGCRIACFPFPLPPPHPNTDHLQNAIN